MPKRYDMKLPANWAMRTKVFTALGDEHRQRIIIMFERDEELSITDIAEVCTLSRTALSYHLRILRDAGVLRAEKRGKSVYLRPDKKLIARVMEGVLDYLQREL